MSTVETDEKKGMNVEAAATAKIYRGRVYYFDHKHGHIDIQEGVYVEVGHYTDEGGEKLTRRQEDSHSTYLAAQLAGYYVHWLCVGDDPCEQRKLLITGPINDKGEVTSLPPVVAEAVVATLNRMVTLAENAPRKSSFQQG